MTWGAPEWFHKETQPLSHGGLDKGMSQLLEKAGFPSASLFLDWLMLGFCRAKARLGCLIGFQPIHGNTSSDSVGWFSRGAQTRASQWSSRQEDKAPQFLFLFDIHFNPAALPHIHLIFVRFVKNSKRDKVYTLTQVNSNYTKEKQSL